LQDTIHLESRLLVAAPSVGDICSLLYRRRSFTNVASTLTFLGHPTFYNLIPIKRTLFQINVLRLFHSFEPTISNTSLETLALSAVDCAVSDLACLLPRGARYHTQHRSAVSSTTISIFHVITRMCVRHPRTHPRCYTIILQQCGLEHCEYRISILTQRHQKGIWSSGMTSS
jgi:hypothetical protein